MAEKLQDLLKQENPQTIRPVSAGPRICPNCGAPTLSEVCQYCGQYVGTVETQDLTAEYPVLQCRNASITFWNFLFPMIFFVMFGFFGFIFPLFFRGFGDDDGFVQLIGLPFAAISIAAGVIIAVHLVRYLSVQFLEQRPRLSYTDIWMTRSPITDVPDRSSSSCWTPQTESVSSSTERERPRSRMSSTALSG